MKPGEPTSADLHVGSELVVRAIAVEPTVERLVSAAVFAALGVFWLVLTGLSRSSGRPAER